MSNVTLTRKLTAGIMALSAAVALAACSSDGDTTETGTETAVAETTVVEGTEGTEGAATDAAPASELPTAEELNAVLAKATDPNVPVEEKTLTVQGSETAPELFEIMTQSKAESGATFDVVAVLPGYGPDTVLTTVNYSTPDQPANTANNVEFVFEGGHWKLQKSWACTLISNTVTPDQVPAMCAAEGAPAQ